MTITKASLAMVLFEKVGFNKAEAKPIVDTFFEEMRQALENGETVKLSGFGNFALRQKRERPGRNPKTLAEVTIKPRTVVTFHPSNKLRALVNDGGRKRG